MNTLHCSTAHDTPLPELSTADPFVDRHGSPLPAALRSEAAGLSWESFAAVYRASGPYRLGSWSATAGPDDLCDYRATLGCGDEIVAVDERASGPIAAMSAILHRIGVGLDIVALHQRTTIDGVITFLGCERNGRRLWSMGQGADSAAASVDALIAGVNRFAQAA
ncbi:2-isopropylmalate synthase [Williamsia sterculiae]|uniref:2-isopropylmalate synthase LeuA allosteric (dimerisation) domain-containing protein n=1 Tax=Williamsia sterculiae TaxID=1344003 RepID=A0A1N7F174_9NOCA|nr:hypothetical protein [Williamsia sterculiae]SIR94133.1 hypothetical protein SAMN05445060_1716 [Williamsia sterculiae]